MESLKLDAMEELHILLFCIPMEYSIRYISLKAVESLKLDFVSKNSTCSLFLIAMKNKQHMDSTAFKEIYLMEYSMAMQKKYYMEFFHGIKFQGLHDQLQILPHGVLHYNAKKNTYGVLKKKKTHSMAFKEIYLMEYSMRMEQICHMEFLNPWYFKNSMCSTKFYPTEYSINREKNGSMEFLKMNIIKELHSLNKIFPHGVLHSDI